MYNKLKFRTILRGVALILAPLASSHADSLYDDYYEYNMQPAAPVQPQRRAVVPVAPAVPAVRPIDNDSYYSAPVQYPTDNDAYYSAPGSYDYRYPYQQGGSSGGCNTIGELPSCGSD